MSEMTPRLVLVDTADTLPGLLPIHAWSALMSSELVLVGADDHPFRPHLELADLRVEVVPSPTDERALTRADLLTGITPEQKARAEWVVDKAREVGEAVYLFGPADADAYTRTVGMEAARAGVEVEVVYFGVAPKGLALLDLVRVEERLRGPGGCPWDREQDHSSLGRFAVEEVYELLEAIGGGQPDDIREELGDVLLQVVFHAQIAEDEGTFTIDDVARGITDKLVRRHPHVFSDVEVADAGEVMANWEALKAAEKPERTGVFDGVAATQPALQYAEKLQSRAAKAGAGSGTGGDGPAAGIHAALGRLDQGAEAAEALGDLLFAAVALARARGVDPETALRGAARRFRAGIEDVSSG
jgi:XTP/dITP diphosphohydrolase